MEASCCSTSGCTMRPRFTRSTIRAHAHQPHQTRPRGIRHATKARAAWIEAETRNFVFRYRSPAHWLEVFRTFYGPTLKAFGALDAAAQTRLANDLIAVIERFNRSGDGSMVVPSEYLEVVVTLR